MLFFIHHEDKPNSLALRQQTRAAHLEYARTFDLRLAGPTLDATGEHMTGSVIILDVPDRAALDAFVANDPYQKAGLFARTTIERWRQTLP